MQISAINAQVSHMGTKNNAQKIQKLEQKHAANQWASEGCTGGLCEKDMRELNLRREYQTLENERVANQWASEGCTGGLSAEKQARMDAIVAELEVIDPETAPMESIPAVSIYDMPKANTYGVPDSTFWGDWAN